MHTAFEVVKDPRSTGVELAFLIGCIDRLNPLNNRVEVRYRGEDALPRTPAD